MLEFGSRIVGSVEITVKKELTENDIETIIVNWFEGGIEWAGFTKQDNEEAFKDKPKDEPVSTWATKVLLDGGEIVLFDEECEEEKFTLTLPKLINGYHLNYINRPHDIDLECGDVITYDCIIQYALFEDIVYG